jgi:hypothetical protein
MDELFAVDGQAREQRLSQHERRVLRLQKARPLLEQIKMAIEAARIDAQESFGQGLQLHSDALVAANPFFGLSGFGAKQ